MERPRRADVYTDTVLNGDVPLGAVPVDGGVRFSLYSSHAERVFLILFDGPSSGPSATIELERVDGTSLWRTFVRNTGPGLLYGYRVAGPHDPARGLRFNPHKFLMDPYARALTGKFRDRDGLLYGYDRRAHRDDLSMDERENAALVPKCIVMDGLFDWDGDVRPAVPPGEMIIYEAHLRGFTAHPSSGVAHPGTYPGFAEKIPHLLELGVTSVELLPVQESYTRGDLVRKGLSDYWGYNTVGFFAPESSYAAGSSPGCQVNEFKTLVRELHRAGLEVILDVVYNHTGEGDELGPTICFRGIDNPSYYALEGPDHQPGRFYRDDTGCKNTLDIEKPAVLRLVLDSLRYWVREMHVDGFRFDLATVLGYEKQRFTPGARLFTVLREDPVLSEVKFIAEPWDIKTRETGRFPSGWMEWNDGYRDTVRGFLRGKGGIGVFATRFAGSQDIFGGGERSACASVNFITAHDGFTLHDLYSFEKKRNEANGEQGLDGTDNNISFNCGAEGITDEPNVLRLRERMIRNGLCVLLLSRGVPMLLSGDEVMRTQLGNNNGYCQDNGTSWFPWETATRAGDMLAFCRGLIKLRKRFSVLRECDFFSGGKEHETGLPDLSWYGPDLEKPRWDDPNARLICCELALKGKSGGPEENGSLFMIFNTCDREASVLLPVRAGFEWRRLCDTGAEDNKRLVPPPGLPLEERGKYRSIPRTVIVLMNVRIEDPPALNPRE